MEGHEPYVWFIAVGGVTMVLMGLGALLEALRDWRQEG